MDSRLRHLLLLGGVLLVLGTGGVFALEVGRRGLERGITELLQTPFKVQRLTVSPGGLTLYQLTLPATLGQPEQAGLPGAVPPLTVERLQIQGSPFRLFRRGWVHADSIEVTGFTLLVDGAPLHGEGHAHLISESVKEPRWEGKFSFQHPFLTGQVELSGEAAQPIVDLTLEVRGSPLLSGQIQGRVAFQGPLDRLRSRGELTSRNGIWGRSTFLLADVRFSGIGPFLHIQNSQLIKPDGVLLVEGPVDLRRIGKPDFLSGLHLTSVEKVLDLAGWRVSPSPSGLTLRRMGESDKASVSLAYEKDETVQSEPLNRQEVEVGYPFSEAERLRIRMNREENFLGVERRGKF